MAKSKLVFPSNNGKNTKDKTSTTNEPSELPRPKKSIRGNSRGK